MSSMSGTPAGTSLHVECHPPGIQLGLICVVMEMFSGVEAVRCLYAWDSCIRAPTMFNWSKQASRQAPILGVGSGRATLMEECQAICDHFL